MSGPLYPNVTRVTLDVARLHPAALFREHSSALWVSASRRGTLNLKEASDTGGGVGGGGLDETRLNVPSISIRSHCSQKLSAVCQSFVTAGMKRDDLNTLRVKVKDHCIESKVELSEAAWPEGEYNICGHFIRSNVRRLVHNKEANQPVIWQRLSGFHLKLKASVRERTIEELSDVEWRWVALKPIHMAAV